jgi:type IV secretion system protein TrbG
VMSEFANGWRCAPVHVGLMLILAGCASGASGQVGFDDDMPPLPEVASLSDRRPGALHVPPVWTPAKGGEKAAREEKEPVARIEAANAAARVEPRRGGYFNAVQVFPFSPGALYQIYAAPGQITDIALQAGEELTGSGPIAAGDTVRWIVGNAESGSGEERRVHVVVKPTRPGIETNLVLNTDRRTYLIELRAREKSYMPSVAWYYPETATDAAVRAPLVPLIPAPDHRHYRYTIEGDRPTWRPLNAYDDGHKVYIEFSPAIGQGEMPPLLVIGPDGQPELVNYRSYKNLLIVDRLFSAAELRLGGATQDVVRVIRR